MKQRYTIQVPVESFVWVTVDADSLDEAMELTRQELEDTYIQPSEPDISDERNWEIECVEDIQESVEQLNKTIVILEGFEPRYTFTVTCGEGYEDGNTLEFILAIGKIINKYERTWGHEQDSLSWTVDSEEWGTEIGDYLYGEEMEEIL